MDDHSRAAMTTPGAGISAMRAQRCVVLSVLAIVVVQDQATKWWAWRHVWAVVNPGATGFLGARLSVPFAAPVAGALLDLAGLVLLSAALVALLRRPRRRLTLVAGAALIAGWTSNLLDRLGLHAVTAPDSERGAVDFIHLGGLYYNVADLYIAGAAVALLVAALLRAPRPGTGDVRRSRLAWSTSPVEAAGMSIVFLTSVLVVAGALHPAAGVAADRDQRVRASSASGFSPNSSRSASA